MHPIAVDMPAPRASSDPSDVLQRLPEPDVQSRPVQRSFDTGAGWPESTQSHVSLKPPITDRLIQAVLDGHSTAITPVDLSIVVDLTKVSPSAFGAQALVTYFIPALGAGRVAGGGRAGGLQTQLSLYSDVLGILPASHTEIEGVVRSLLVALHLATDPLNSDPLVHL